MNDVQQAYDAAATAWREGPERIYAGLARTLVGTVEVGGRRVLDLGAGTGVAAREALAAGAAAVVRVDLAASMLRAGVVPGPAVAADAARLPFRDAAFDVVVAAFSLGHLPRPLDGLRECRRIAPVLAASAFDPSWGHPAKAAVDEAMASYGFTLPAWYGRLKAGEAQVEGRAGLLGLAREAGFARAEVSRFDVDTGVRTPAAMVRWRWGMAHLAPYVATLDPATRDRARADAERAVTGMPPVVVPMLVLTAAA